MRSLFRRSEGLFEPRMPEVDAPATLPQVFDQARAAAGAGAGQGSGTATRSVVVVTPGRLLMLQPCPPPGAMPAPQVADIQKLIAPQPQRHIAAISYTEIGAVKADIAKAIPFIGILLGFAYIGHAAWVFEGHPSALAHGCREADVLLVDGGMLPHLQSDWRAVASGAMRRPEIYVHDRATYRLLPAAHAAAS